MTPRAAAYLLLPPPLPPLFANFKDFPLPLLTPPAGGGCFHHLVNGILVVLPPPPTKGPIRFVMLFDFSPFPFFLQLSFLTFSEYSHESSRFKFYQKEEIYQKKKRGTRMALEGLNEKGGTRKYSPRQNYFAEAVACLHSKF